MTTPSVPPDTGDRLKMIEEALFNLQRERTSVDSTLDNCPTGMVAGFLSSRPPAGWVSLDGTVVTLAAYPRLYAYLVANGFSTTLPDYRDRVPIGAGNLYTSTSTGGTADNNVVTHTHTGPDHNHAQVVTSGTTGTATRNDYVADSAGLSYAQGVNTGNAGTGATGSTGSSGTNANLPPYRGLYWMIRS